MTAILLTYNKTSSHVKANGAVVGTINVEALTFTPFIKDKPKLAADNLMELLAAIRKSLTQ